VDTKSGSGFKKVKLAHKAMSVPLPSLQGPDSAVSLNSDSSGWIRIPDQDLRREFHSWVYRIRFGFRRAIKSGF
jgi:hypothetical protein